MTEYADIALNYAQTAVNGYIASSAYAKYEAEANAYADRYELTGALDGARDAFRHAYASARMAQDSGQLAAEGVWIFE